MRFGDTYLKLRLEILSGVENTIVKYVECHGISPSLK